MEAGSYKRGPDSKAIPVPASQTRMYMGKVTGWSVFKEHEQQRTINIKDHPRNVGVSERNFKYILFKVRVYCGASKA
jgi:hypothetical protein